MFAEPVIVTTIRRKRHMMYRGYKYCEDIKTKGHKRWYCSSHHNDGCKATVKTLNDVLVAANVHHIHGPYPQSLGRQAGQAAQGVKAEPTFKKPLGKPYRKKSVATPKIPLSLTESKISPIECQVDICPSPIGSPIQDPESLTKKNVPTSQDLDKKV